MRFFIWWVCFIVLQDWRKVRFEKKTPDLLRFKHCPKPNHRPKAQPSTLLFKAFNDCWGTLWAGFGEKNNIILGYYVVISGPLDLYLSKFCGLYLFIFLKGLTGIFFFFFNLWNFSFVLFTGVWQPWPTGVALVFKLSFFFVCLFVFFFFFLKQLYNSIFTVFFFFKVILWKKVIW